MAGATAPTVSFELLGANGNPATLVPGTAAALILRLLNTGTDALQLVAGPPADEDAAGVATDGAVRWYLPFPSELPESTISALTFAADGWTPTPYQFHARTYWGFVRRDHDASLAAGATVDFAISGLTVPESLPASLAFTAAWYSGNPAAESDVPFSVPVAAPSVRDTLSAVIQADKDHESAVYVSQPGESYPNTIIVALQNGTAPLDAAGTVEIEVPITALSGPGTEAVTTSEFAAQISCDILFVPEGFTWTKPQPKSLPNGNAGFALSPTSSPALPAGGTLQITLGNIISPLPPGEAHITVRWSKFAAVDDGSVDLPLLLSALPASPVLDCEIVPAGTFDFDSPLSVRWTTTYATTLELDYDDGIAPISLSSKGDGLPFTGTHPLPDATVDAVLTVTASNVGGIPTVTPLQISVTPVAPTFTVSANVPAYSFDNGGTVHVVYTFDIAPARLLIDLRVTVNGTEQSIKGQPTFATTLTATTGPTFTATFGTGLGKDPLRIPVTPTMQRFEDFLPGTTWLGIGDGAPMYLKFAGENTIEDVPGWGACYYIASGNGLVIIWKTEALELGQALWLPPLLILHWSPGIYVAPTWSLLEVKR